MNPVLEVLAALLPPAGVAFLFWLAMRSIIGADRNERKAIAELERRSAERPVTPADVHEPSGAAPEGSSPTGSQGA